ncbi:MAG: HEAT repeat domain-containing protein [Cellvibrionaceae bacterium]
MNLKLLHKGTEEERGWKIIDVSRNKDVRYIPQLHAILTSNETVKNKRHAIRAIANIGSMESKSLLLELLEKENGVILGELCRAAKALEILEAIELIKPLINHQEQWIQQEANGALKKLKALNKAV